jgi:truncated hemoglobin YjbI
LINPIVVPILINIFTISEAVDVNKLADTFLAFIPQATQDTRFAELEALYRFMNSLPDKREKTYKKLQRFFSGMELSDNTNDKLFWETKIKDSHT